MVLLNSARLFDISALLALYEQLSSHFFVTLIYFYEKTLNVMIN